MQLPNIKNVFEFPTYWFSVRSHNHYTIESTVSVRHRKAFSNLQSCLTGSIWICLILLIKLIKYKIGKKCLFSFGGRSYMSFICHCFYPILATETKQTVATAALVSHEWRIFFSENNYSCSTLKMFVLQLE